MANLFTIPAGIPFAGCMASYLLTQQTPEQLASAVLLLPTRRSCSVLRQALQQKLGGRAALLPTILPLAESEAVAIRLLGMRAPALLSTVPQAMAETQQRYLLTKQVMAFEKQRSGGISLQHALLLADGLMAMQQQCAQAGVPMSEESLRRFAHGDHAHHWKESLLFLSIISERWPDIERAFGQTIAPMREQMLLCAIATALRESAPDFSIWAIGSTGSQQATAALLKTIADLPQGRVVLPGLDPNIGEEEWAAIAPGHPLFHIKSLLNLWPLSPHNVTRLADAPRSIWLDALLPAPLLPQWKGGDLPSYASLSTIACAHSEEETRVISLLLRETLETPGNRVALITPDEGLMARVARHMRRYEVTVDRPSSGTIATTACGALWMALAAALHEPHRLLPLRHLLQHSLLAIDSALLAGLEAGWHGPNRTRAGQLPRHDKGLLAHPQFSALADFVATLAALSTQRHMASEWVEHCTALLARFQHDEGQGAEAVREQCELLAEADSFGRVDSGDFLALLSERLATRWRDAGLATHPHIFMLTPTEARMGQFDRIILANMQDSLWPGNPPPNPWLNLSAQAALGLPSMCEPASRTAHDIVMLASCGEVFLTYPLRDGGAPVSRSRFIDRLVALLACHGIAEQQIEATKYRHWANLREASETYAPEAKIFPRPAAGLRPHRLPVSDLDRLFTNPFSIYVKHVLGLRPLEPIDAPPEASDFGTLAHHAIELLSQHWNSTMQPANETKIAQIIEQSLRGFSDRPTVDLFWRTRLRNALNYVNRLEAELRPMLAEVASEETIEGAMALPKESTIALYGRIDRLEKTQHAVRVVDYKTGAIPKMEEVLTGRALQLFAYQVLLKGQGEQVESIAYWSLPKLGEEGEQLQIEFSAAQEAALAAQLAEALAHMLDEKTPFLATGSGERGGEDYDGISRYGEWGG